MNLRPDPRVLIAITNNPMRPVDALCELVDNSIDSFYAAAESGSPITSPTLEIWLPSANQIAADAGEITVFDNGPGLTYEQTRNALSAGYSGNNPFDRLGLFGMGFNTSTGKLGRRTVFRTAQRSAEHMVDVTIDLEDMVQQGTYDVPVDERMKEPVGFHGTQVRISEWWPRGSQNYGFALKLVKLGLPSIRRELGRRYATILRESGVRIFVNGEPCEPFEHCVWSEQRSIQHRELGTIPAVIRFDRVLHTQVRCSQCYILAESGGCPNCGSSNSLRTIEERVRGWVGIQRFDDQNNYGIVLMRNGRAIRVSEKEAFFTWVNDLGHQEIDYPVDSIFGRIVGEVHLNHVPTDFLKQDFQRTSPEWARAVAFLRGETSLRPQAAAQSGVDNDSPIYKLFQGYRRVRDMGTRDMYMGYWEPGQSKAKRISRETEREYYERFRRKEPGFFDDSEWWKLVEQADTRPIPDMKECPECGFQTLASAETCSSCDYVFLGKLCIMADCGATMPRSSVVCPVCGNSQHIEPQVRWSCSFCGHSNSPGLGECARCGRAAGDTNPLSLDYLLEHSHRDDSLSIEAFSVALPSGATASPLDVNVYTMEVGEQLMRDGISLPSVTFRDGDLRIFLDGTHPLLAEYQERPENVIAMEIAKFLQDGNSRHMTGERAHLWSLPALCWLISRKYWAETLSIDPERTRRQARDFFDRLRESLPQLLAPHAREIHESLAPPVQGQLVAAMGYQGYAFEEISELILSGEYLRFVDYSLLPDLVYRYPSCFFDGRFWTDPYSSDNLLGEAAVAQQLQEVTVRRYQDFLKDVLSFLSFQHRDRAYVSSMTARVGHTLQLLEFQIAR